MHLSKIIKHLFILIFLFSNHFVLIVAQEQAGNFIPAEASYMLQSSQQIASQAVWLNKSFVSLSVENKYSLSELTNKMICAGFRIQKDLFLFRLSHFGHKKMGTFHANVGYCRELSSKFALGLQFHYFLDHAYQYRSTHSVTLDISASVRASEKLQIGFSVYNPIALRYGVTGEEMIPIAFASDIIYKIGTKSSIWLQIMKEQPGGLHAHGGINLQLKSIFLSVGAGNRHCQVAIAVPYKKFIFQFKSEYSFRLGYSPTLNTHYLY